MAAVDYFLKIDGIEGESQDAKHAKEVDVLSWSWGQSQAATSGAGGGGGGAGKVSMQDFHFTMSLNKASPKLMQACATGQHVKSATLTARKAGKTQAEYLTFKFSDILVSSYQTGGNASSDALPIDQISLNFSKIEVTYKEQKPDGSLQTGTDFKYDLKQNKTF
jgi:type VI secretion system secreted protein Hcp